MKAILWDLGGVFATNSPRLFIREFSIKNDIPVEEVVKAFKVTFGDWLEGKVSEQEHWNSFLGELNLPIPEDVFAKDCGGMLRFFSVAEGDVLTYIKELKKLNEKREEEDQIKQAIASNNTKELGLHLTEEYDLGEVFDALIYSGDIGVAKPEKEFFTKVAEKLGVATEDCIFIDDKEKNLAPAEELGMTTILFKDLKQLKEEIESLIEVKK